jgi:hypothetical protein
LILAAELLIKPRDPPRCLTHVRINAVR